MMSMPSVLPPGIVSFGADLEHPRATERAPWEAGPTTFADHSEPFRVRSTLAPTYA
jgi:hypothetical protein